MVKSTIKPEIEYNESKRIDAEDMDYETFVYEAEIFEKRVAICVGKIKYTHTGRGVIFYPVYLLSDDNVVRSQIGVFEMESKDLPNYLDAENKLDAEIFAKDGNKVLLYKFVTKEFLEMSKSNPEFYKKVLVEEPRKIEVEEESVLSVLDLQQKHNSKIKEREKDENKGVFEEIGNAHIPDGNMIATVFCNFIATILCSVVMNLQLHITPKQTNSASFNNLLVGDFAYNYDPINQKYIYDIGTVQVQQERNIVLNFEDKLDFDYYYTYTTDHFYNISYARIPQTGITVNRGTRKVSIYCNFNMTWLYPILFFMVKMIIPNVP
jgi:hypothetical protein